MAGYLCRWSRTHPKTFEAVANHCYTRSTVVVETNLLSPMGRGTLPRRLLAAEKGLNWLQVEPLPERIIVCNGSARRRRLQRGAMVVTGSSARQVLGNGTVQLVLTDPPYHDDLQYGELSRLFHVWLGVALATPPPAEDTEAVPNPVRGTDTHCYEDIVSECFRESLRTLAPDGRLVLTFHNHNLAAWTALRNALIRSGFFVVGLATVSAENSADHGKRNRRTFLCDLVIECVRRPARGAAGVVSLMGRADTEQRRNLLAIGRALAETVNMQLSCGLKERYEEHLSRMGKGDKLIR
jgi:adenine-specific DNA methylase